MLKDLSSPKCERWDFIEECRTYFKASIRSSAQILDARLPILGDRKIALIVNFRSIQVVPVSCPHRTDIDTTIPQPNSSREDNLKYSNNCKRADKPRRQLLPKTSLGSRCRQNWKSETKKKTSSNTQTLVFDLFQVYAKDWNLST